jgi:hypothetical protein
MSRGLGSFAMLTLSGNVARAAGMFGFIDKVVVESCDDKLEKSAKELAEKMKQMLVRKQCGLSLNTMFTVEMKGTNTPLIDSSQLANSITYKLLDKGQADLPGNKSNRFKAAFVGVLRDGMLKSGGSLIGKQTPVALVTIAKNMVKGYTVTMPSNKVKKHVPSRDFRKEPWRDFKEQYYESMKDGVASGFGKMV